MKRLFCKRETRVYDYQKVTEADKHIKEMKAKGWKTVIKDEEYQECVYHNGQDEFPWSVEFFKEA